MWIRIYRPTGGHLYALRAMSLLCFLISVAIIVGSFRLMIVKWADDFSLWGN